MRFRLAVATEFERRRRLNPRYSLRGFARAVGVHHSTLSRLLRSRRPVPHRTVSALGRRLGLSRQEVALFAARENVAAVAEAIGRATFRPDARWLASVAGISVDGVHVALQTLLRLGRLRMVSRLEWVLEGEGMR
ncbi:MAG: helix-turn-helix domain-containing protein [Acidimicrobiia bacterium]